MIQVCALKYSLVKPRDSPWYFPVWQSSSDEISPKENPLKFVFSFYRYALSAFLPSMLSFHFLTDYKWNKDREIVNQIKRRRYETILKTQKYQWNRERKRYRQIWENEIICKLERRKETGRSVLFTLWQSCLCLPNLQPTPNKGFQFWTLLFRLLSSQIQFAFSKFNLIYIHGFEQIEIFLEDNFHINFLKFYEDFRVLEDCNILFSSFLLRNANFSSEYYLSWVDSCQKLATFYPRQRRKICDKKIVLLGNLVFAYNFKLKTILKCSGQVTTRATSQPHVEGWMIHFVLSDPERRLKHYWVLANNAIHMYNEYNEG